MFVERIAGNQVKPLSLCRVVNAFYPYGPAIRHEHFIFGPLIIFFDSPNEKIKQVHPKGIY